jgi:hypothetical protein
MGRTLLLTLLLLKVGEVEEDMEVTETDSRGVQEGALVAIVV